MKQLLEADSLESIQTAVAAICNHLRLKIRSTAYPPLRCIQFMEAVSREMGQLEIENRRLRESNPDQEKLLELEADLEQSKDEIAHLAERLEDVPRLEQQLSEALQQGEQLRQELQARNLEADEREGETQLRQSLAQAESDAAEARTRLEESEARAAHFATELECREEELMRTRKDTELEIYRAVDLERRKWESREERLTEQLANLQAQLRTERTGSDLLRNREFTEGRSQRNDDRPADETTSRELRAAYTTGRSVTQLDASGNVSRSSPVQFFTPNGANTSIALAKSVRELSSL